jgi:hypothetical protein
MTGKEKLLKWIERASVDDLKNLINKGLCPEEFGLFNPENCEEMDLSCDDCVKQALEKEYSDES